MLMVLSLSNYTGDNSIYILTSIARCKINVLLCLQNYLSNKQLFKLAYISTLKTSSKTSLHYKRRIISSFGRDVWVEGSAIRAGANYERHLMLTNYYITRVNNNNNTFSRVTSNHRRLPQTQSIAKPMQSPSQSVFCLVTAKGSDGFSQAVLLCRLSSP